MTRLFLQPNQWLTLQSYLLVTGSRAGLWDCTSPNWQDHWTTDAERYCWNDYQTILNSIPSAVTTTDPKTVAQAWGRTNYTPPTATAPPHLSDQTYEQTWPSSSRPRSASSPRRWWSASRNPAAASSI